MMTMLMDNTCGISNGERVQHLYNKNVELENKRRKAAQARIPFDPSVWQQMRENYEAILLEDHAFCEKHEIEYALWQLHYRRIEELRALLNVALASSSSATFQNGKSPTRRGPDRIAKICSQFKTFLSEATGFYLDLMVKIRAKYGLPLGYFSDDSENQIILSKDGNVAAEAKTGLISCHRCLIYLGDLTRYKGLYGDGDSKGRDFAAASSYYMQASSLWPSSGNPHHQLAILASYSGDELFAIYRYFRSLAVDNPFTTARDNLIIAFDKNRQSYSLLLGHDKAPIKKGPVRMTGRGRGKGEMRLQQKDNRVETTLILERASSIPEVFKVFSIRFVRLNGIIFTRTSLETFEEVFSMARSNLMELLSSGPDEQYNFGSDAAECSDVIVRLVAILIFTCHNVKRETENQSYAEILQRSVLLQNAFIATFEFMGHILERCIQLHDLSASCFLPGVMVFMEWLACHPDIAVGTDVEEKQENARSFFWNQCISFLNKLLSSELLRGREYGDETCFFNMCRYDEGETANRLALSEDFELRGFLPLLPAQLILEFSRKHSFASDGGIKGKEARCQRIIAAGKSLANVVWMGAVGQEGIYFDPKSKRFAIGVEPQISDDYLVSSSLGMPISNGISEETPVESTETPVFLQPKASLSTEGEEEDEVIVFKPNVTDKHVNENASKLTSDVFQSDIGGPNVGLHDGYLLQNDFNMSSTQPAYLATPTSQCLQPIQPNASKEPVELVSVANKLINMSLLDNEFFAKHELNDHFGAVQPVSLPVVFSHQCVNSSFGSRHIPQVLENVVTSKFDSVMSSSPSADIFCMKLPSMVPAGLRKSPVSRPVRHSGPPPGFSSVPSKLVDESLSTVTVKNESPIDDYSWLDGFHLLSSMQSLGFNSVKQSAQMYQPIGKSNGAMGKLSLPFPGKHALEWQIPAQNQKGQQEHKFADQLNRNQEQQRQLLHMGNQQSVALPEQYQGQSLWEGGFFV